jgi:hypothetical protein
MEFMLAKNRERSPLLVGQISAHRARSRQAQSAWDLSASPPMVSVQHISSHGHYKWIVLHAAYRPSQARILPHLSIRRLFERRPSAEDGPEGGDLLRTGPKSTAGGRRGSREEESGRQRLPRSLAPWHTLPFMTKEVGPSLQAGVTLRSCPGSRACATTAVGDFEASRGTIQATEEATLENACLCVGLDIDTLTAPNASMKVQRLASAINRSVSGRWARARVAVRESRARARERRASRKLLGSRGQHGSMLRLPWRRRRDAAEHAVPDAAHDAAVRGLACQRALDVRGAIAAYEVAAHLRAIAGSGHRLLMRAARRMSQAASVSSGSSELQRNLPLRWQHMS